MPRKAPNGFGSIRKKIVNGRVYYEARYTDPILHKQKSISATTEKTCREKLKAVFVAITTGNYATPSKKTTGEWLDEWLDKLENVEESTRQGAYANAIRRYIKPHVGSIQLQELRRVHCQEFVRALGHASRPLSAKTIRDAVGVLSAALEDAVKLDMIPKNPAKELDLPRYDRKPPKVMDSAAQATFVEAIKDSPYRNIFLVGLHTGARISEILGLQWENIDLCTGAITICGQLERDERKLKHSTKTHKARTIIVPPFVIDLFKDEKRRQSEYRLKAGQQWANADGLVFTRQDGTPMPHNTISNSFKRIARRIGHPELSFHALRHTYITDELRYGETDIKTISDSVGHSRISTTMDIYAASTDEMKRAAAERRQQAHDVSQTGAC